MKFQILILCLFLSACDHLSHARRIVPVKNWEHYDCMKSALSKHHSIEKDEVIVYKDSPKDYFRKVYEEHGLVEVHAYQIKNESFPFSANFFFGIEKCSNGKSYLAGGYNAINGLNNQEAVQKIDEELRGILKACHKEDLIPKIRDSKYYCDQKLVPITKP